MARFPLACQLSLLATLVSVGCGTESSKPSKSTTATNSSGTTSASTSLATSTSDDSRNKIAKPVPVKPEAVPHAEPSPRSDKSGFKKSDLSEKTKREPDPDFFATVKELEANPKELEKHLAGKFGDLTGFVDFLGRNDEGEFITVSSGSAGGSATFQPRFKNQTSIWKKVLPGQTVTFRGTLLMPTDTIFVMNDNKIVKTEGPRCLTATVEEVSAACDSDPDKARQIFASSFRGHCVIKATVGTVEKTKDDSARIVLKHPGKCVVEAISDAGGFKVGPSGKQPQSGDKLTILGQMSISPGSVKLARSVILIDE